MATAFSRQLGAQPGIQLNPLQDNTDGFAPDNSDQVFAIAMRSTRGRIDKPFKVNRSNVFRKLGRGEPVRVSALNEAHIHVVEALSKGAYEAVVHRLVTSAAEIEYIVAVDGATPTFSVETALPGTPYVFAIKHLECFNDGIKVSYHADEPDGGGPATMIILRITDKDNIVLFEFEGSLDPAAKDDYGQSLYMPDVIGRSTDLVEITIPASTSIPDTSGAYGRDSNGFDKFATSAVMAYFTEGGTGYVSADYIAAREKLQYSEYDFGYISTGGSKAVGLIAQMVILAYETNRQLRLDVDGTLDPDAAIAFVDSLNIDSHYVHAFWSPLKSDDPLGVNGKIVLGAATFNIAKACARNARTDAKGFAPKNFPIAGKDWPLERTGISQLYQPTEYELNDLAKAKINPVIYERYNGGGRFVFTDSLTLAKTQVSFRKLIAVADMSSTIDEWVTRFGKEVLQLPMQTAIKKTQDYLRTLFEGATAAGWLVPSAEMDGATYQFEVKPNELRPADRMDVNYTLRYDGTLRQIFVTQTLSR